MTLFRIALLILAIVQAVLAVFTALVGSPPPGEPLWSVLVDVLVHPLCAAGLLLLVALPRPAAPLIFGIAALLMLNVVADLSFALMIAQGAMKGDWWLPLILMVVPAIGVVYALVLTRLRRRPAPV